MRDPAGSFLSGPTTVVLAALVAVATQPFATAQGVYPYRAIDLGVPPTQVSRAGVGAAAISADHRHVGGTSVWEPYVWTAGSGMRSLPKLPGKLNGEVFDVAADGAAVGSCGWEATTNQLVATFWDPAGQPRSLGGLGGPFSRAVAMNGSGLVVGHATVPRGPSYGWHAFTWTAATGMVDLTPTAGSAAARDLNEAGQVLLSVDGVGFRYSAGAGFESFGSVTPLRINELGQLTGKDASGVSGRYTDGLGWEWFGGAGNVELSAHGSINNLGQVAGTQSIRVQQSPPRYERHGYVYTFGVGFQKLDDWIDPAQQVTVRRVAGITDDGTIACDGSIGPVNRAMLLEPRFTSHYGRGCAGGDGTPKVSAFGIPRAGGTLAFLGAGGRGVASCVFLFSPFPASIPLPGGCTLLVDPQSIVAVSAPTNPFGQASLVLSVPQGTPAGALHAQLGSIDPRSGNGVFALSDGVRVDLQ